MQHDKSIDTSMASIHSMNSIVTKMNLSVASICTQNRLISVAIATDGSDGFASPPRTGRLSTKQQQWPPMQHAATTNNQQPTTTSTTDFSYGRQQRSHLELLPTCNRILPTGMIKVTRNVGQHADGYCNPISNNTTLHHVRVRPRR